MKFRRVIVWIAPVIATGLLTWVSRGLDWNAALTHIRLLTSLEILVILLFPLTYYATTAWRFQKILAYLEARIRFRTAMELVIGSFAASYLIPSFDIAGKAVKFGVLRGAKRVPVEKTVLALSVEAIVGSGVDVAARIILFFALGLTTFLGSMVFKIALVVALVTALAFFSLLVPRRLVAKVVKHQRFLKAYETLRQEYLHLLERPRQLATIAFVTFIGFNLGFLEFIIVPRLLGIPMDVKTAFLAFTAFHVAWMIPSPGGLATVESAMVSVFWAFGQNPVFALAIAMTFRLKEFFWVLTGLAIVAKNGISIFKRNSIKF